MVIKMCRCITVIYFREVESKREIHNHNQRTLHYLTGNPRIPLQYVPQAATQSQSLFKWNSVTQSSVLSHYRWHYQPTDILKSSQRHLEIFLPSVIKSSVV